MLFYPAVRRIRSCMQDANTLCWDVNPTRKRQISIYESSSLSWHSGMLSLFDSLIRINHVYVSFFVSLFLLMLFIRLYLARMRLHIICTHHGIRSVRTKCCSIFLSTSNIILIPIIILKSQLSRTRAARF